MIVTIVSKLAYNLFTGCKRSTYIGWNNPSTSSTSRTSVEILEGKEQAFLVTNGFVVPKIDEKVWIAKYFFRRKAQVWSPIATKKGYTLENPKMMGFVEKVTLDLSIAIFGIYSSNLWCRSARFTSFHISLDKNSKSKRSFLGIQHDAKCFLGGSGRLSNQSPHHHRFSLIPWCGHPSFSAWFQSTGMSGWVRDRFTIVKVSWFKTFHQS